MKKHLSTIALLLVVFMIAACSLDVAPKTDPTPSNINYKEIEYFSDEAELLSYVDEYFVNHIVYDYDESISVPEVVPALPMPTPVPVEPSAAPIAPSPAPVAPSAPSATGKNESVSDSVTEIESDDVSSTNVQVEGIDEGDILKTDGDFIYIINGDRFTIIDIRGEEPVECSTINISTENNYRYINEMYIKGDYAILIYNENVAEEHRYTDGSKFVDDPTGTYVPQPYIYYTYKNYTTIAIYDISDRENPFEARKLSFEGNSVSTREMNGKLYLVNNKYLSRYGVTPVIEDILPTMTDSITGDCTPEATDIAKCIWDEPQSNIMTVAIIDYTSDERPETLHIIGSGSNIYMNHKNLYVFNNGWADGGSFTGIAKYSITDGIKSIGTAKAPGYASTQFSYDEYDGKFRIATTANIYNGEKYIDMNNIYVYDENLELCGSLTGLAPDESIKSARFMGDTAYLVTFRQVDPLFVIDMSEDDPVVLGELKVPGFSTYMHPVGDGLLLGIGSETVDKVYGDWVSTSVSGLKVSLFDVSDPMNPTELDVANYVGGKNAYSVAKDNHNAFVYSASTNTGYFPLTTYDEMWNNTDTLAEVKITEDGLDVRVADLEKIYNYYSESRVCYAGKYIYLYRNCSITKLDRESLEFICEISLTTP
ncbi:MAG: beta-propeller domain-containing protein [Clostridia bacterium]|nr:beta-propeller domain-containing protein [Clostridia bacterium]